jgi:glutaredoxin 3
MLNLISRIFGKKISNINAKVEIYTWQTCPYCIKAKLLLWLKGCEYLEHKIDGDEEARKLMKERAKGKKTLPQIFINNEHIGGCDDLYNLEQKNKLDFLLNIRQG